MLARLITTIMGWAVAIFLDVRRAGPPAPDGPLLVVANHPNALIDPLVVLRTAGRPVRPLAKAPLFEQPLVGLVLQGLRGLPVYRRQDDPSLVRLNEGTLDAAVEALTRGEAVQIYPEGQSHSEPSLVPLKTGAARIALDAAAARGWQSGLRIQPVGLVYSRKHVFRGDVSAVYGRAFEVDPWRNDFDRDPRAAVRELTTEIQRRLEAVTLNLDRSEDRVLVETAERLYARDRRTDEGDDLGTRLPLLQRFARGQRWLRLHDPDRHAELVRQVERYRRIAALLGAPDIDPEATRLGPAVLSFLARATFLTAGGPAALAGGVVWAVPYHLTRWTAPRFRPALDQVATYKLAVALLAFPLWWILLVAGTGASAGLGWAMTVAFLAPLLGLAAIAWRELGRGTLDDARAWSTAARNPRGRERLRDLRAALVEEFAAVAAAEEASRGTDHEAAAEAP